MAADSREIEPRFFTKHAKVRGADSLSVPLDITDPAQHNPSYRHRPGIHGWVMGEAGLERIDIDPVKVIPVPLETTDSVTE